LLDQTDNSLNYHSKEIYFSYLMLTNHLGVRAKHYIYQQGRNELNQEFVQDTSQMAGVIVLGLLPEAYLNFLADKNIPVVLINHFPPVGLGGRVGSVHIDTQHISQAINYLISLNHQKILFCHSAEYQKGHVYAQRKDASAKNLIRMAG
jgi:DNA-binding LacI/PurR family transcriptional regulator